MRSPSDIHLSVCLSIEKEGRINRGSSRIIQFHMRRRMQTEFKETKSEGMIKQYPTKPARNRTSVFIN